MSFNLSEKLKSLHKERNISQEKLAQYLKVSFQAVSKWENGNSYPDIFLLPEIARFFEITIDELMQVEKLDEEKLYQEYERRAEESFRNGNYGECLTIWLEAYQQMPNNLQVKEMLMSAYYDADQVKYQNEIIELGVEIYNSNVPMYYKGQAIRQIANTYAATGNMESAEKWAKKSVSIFHSQEILFTEIFDGDELLHDVGFCTYWFFNHLFYMAARIDKSKTVTKGLNYKQDVYKTVSKLYEVLYNNDDMDYESMKLLYLMHRRISEIEIELSGREETVKFHLNRAFVLATKSAAIQCHQLTHPMLSGWKVQASPTDSLKMVRLMNKDLNDHIFDIYRHADWFTTMKDTLKSLLNK